MEQALERLDRAYALGEQELALLVAEEVDQVERLSSERAGLIQDVVDTAAEAEGPAQEILLEKLRRLEALQGRLTGEARRLHERLRDDLARVKKETKRLSGYGDAVRPVPLVRNRYVNKKS